MRFTCEKSSLLDSILLAQKSVPSKLNVGSIQGLFVETSDNSIRISGFDTERSVQVTAMANVQESGSGYFPVQLFASIVKALPSGAVTVEAKDTDCTITSGKSVFSLRLYTNENHSDIKKPNQFSYAIPGKAFGHALDKVVRAASKDSGRQVLTGVLLSAEDNGVRLVATDSYRLSMCDISDASILKSGQSVLIPSKSLEILSEMIADLDELLNVELSETEVDFAIGDKYLKSRLIEGQFPDYRPLLPKEFSSSVQFEKNELLDGLGRVKLVASDLNTPVRMSVSSEGVELLVIGHNTGRASEFIDAKLDGEEITIAFNPAFLQDGLRAIESNDVVIEMTNPLKPAVVKAIDDSNSLYLIMPVRVS